MSVDHYENFPVASLLVPKPLRPAIQAIYRFARSADDLADEGDATAQERLEALEAYQQALARIHAGMPAESLLFSELAQVIHEYQLPLQLFQDLLNAFAQDVVKTRYSDYDELLDYCRRSADPVGRLMLHLMGCPTPENLSQSDKICTALQLINFWQDIAIDWNKARIYLPLADLAAFGLSEADIARLAANGQYPAGWRALMHFQITRTRQLMLEGLPLVHQLPGRMGWEIRLTVQGGLRILEKLEAVDGQVFHHRPTLNAADWLRMLWRAFTMRPTL